jgi:GrpB-like predicted nucleotidyltransferase (UPF0157 family)
MTDQIVISEYDPEWPAIFEAEVLRILKVTGDTVTEVEHVGSTSVPGLGAKPIIDIMAAVPQIDDAKAIVEPLGELGYRYLPEYEELIPERRFFRRGIDSPTHHLHVVERTTDFWIDHLLFRDYLRAHPETAKEYEAIKRNLAASIGDDRAAFTVAKTSFIEPVVARAKAWRREDSTT